MLSTEQRLSALLSAPEHILKRVDAIIKGEPTEAEPGDRRLLTFQAAADALGISRTTVWRLARDGQLPVVEIRPGVRRVPSAVITAFARKGMCA